MMIKYKTSSYLLNFINRSKNKGKSIGFVPTMGALHEGHISLIKAAKETCNLVVCSIFVNPTQFNHKSDLDKYPRTEEQDCAMLKAAGCDVVFLPSVAEMYPKGTKNGFEPPAIGVIASLLEGKHRPGHFEGMMQVVSLLLDKVQPTHLYMGLKDYQQFLICSKMVAAQKRNIVMCGMPIVREKNGLAMSSRNKRLSATGREYAAVLYKTLVFTKENITTINTTELLKTAVNSIEKQEGMKVEYFEIVDKDSLLPSTKKTNLIALLAVWFEEVRLIDNMIL